MNREIIENKEHAVGKEIQGLPDQDENNLIYFDQEVNDNEEIQHENQNDVFYEPIEVDGDVEDTDVYHETETESRKTTQY